MRNVGTRNKAKDWIRLAAKVSLLFTEPRVREAISDRLKDTVSDLTDTISGKYDDMADRVSSKYADAVDRVEAAADALQGQGYWPSRVDRISAGGGNWSGIGNSVGACSRRSRSANPFAIKRSISRTRYVNQSRPCLPRAPRDEFKFQEKCNSQHVNETPRKERLLRAGLNTKH